MVNFEVSIRSAQEGSPDQSRPSTGVGGDGVRPALSVLLGAGASLPYISGVHDLTERLVAWGRYRVPGIGDDTHSTQSPLAERGSSDTRTPFFRGLRQILGSGYRDGETGLSFEHLIHVCDELAHVLPNKRDDRFRWMPRSFFQLRDEYAAWGGAHVPLALIAEEARYFILEHIADECDLVAEPSPISTGLGTLADRFLLGVHSLNYDTLGIPADLDVYTGFDKDTGYFHPRYPWPNDVDTFVQLHGSVLWGLVDAEILAFDCIDKARANRESQAIHRVFQDGHALPLAPMVTGLRKADIVLERPYGTYFHSFRDHFLATPRWLIIGYGFGDPHVNRVLQQAWASWAMRGTSARAVVIDHLPSGDRNVIAPGSEDTRGWAKVGRLLSPVFRQELDPQWHLRDSRPFPAEGLVEVGNGHLAVQFDGGDVAMTAGLGDIARFLAG